MADRTRSSRSGENELSVEVDARLWSLGEVVDRSMPTSAQLGAAGESAGVVDISWATMASPVGTLVLAATEAGLLRVSFDEAEDTLADLADLVSPRILEGRDRLSPALRQIDEYFDGARVAFDLALDTQLSRGFRADVLGHLRGVPYGSTVTYADLASAAGSPKATRAVGSSMATNPIPIVVPCHRVVRSDGSLGGYAGGLGAKEWLLGLEGIDVPRR